MPQSDNAGTTQQTNEVGTTQRADTHEQGPFNVKVIIEYTYNKKRYRVWAETEHPGDPDKKKGPDVICFDRKLASRIRCAFFPESKEQPQKGDGSDWSQKEMEKPEKIRESPPVLNQHTPICWHESGCTFWCI